jgi:hypothetical protein
MAKKINKQKPQPKNEPRISRLQILFLIMSALLILSMILSAFVTY